MQPETAGVLLEHEKEKSKQRNIREREIGFMTFTLINEMKTIINGRKAFEVARACVEIPLIAAKKHS
ncbi:hypothetical protein C961_03109 [Brucella ovis F8/05B]|nr:hypothetical protein C961_03109 [Brucella ovis F8/05B]